MKTSVYFNEFCDYFRDMDRNDNFSYSGKRALYDYFIQYEEETGSEIELDIIAICCEFTEYDDLEDFQKNYSEDYKTMDDIQAQTIVIEVEGGANFIVQDF